MAEYHPATGKEVKNRRVLPVFTAGCTGTRRERQSSTAQAAILSNSIWNCANCTPTMSSTCQHLKEACKDKLKPTYGHSCGSLTIDNFDGFYTCTSSRFIMEPDTGPYITYVCRSGRHDPQTLPRKEAELRGTQ